MTDSDMTAAARFIARRPDADDPAMFTEYPTMAAMYADALGLGEVTATRPVPQTARQHLTIGHTATRKPVLK